MKKPKYEVVVIYIASSNDPYYKIGDSVGNTIYNDINSAYSYCAYWNNLGPRKAEVREINE